MPLTDLQIAAMLGGTDENGEFSWHETRPWRDLNKEAAMANPPEGFDVTVTLEDVAKMYERFFRLPEGCLVEQADGSHIMRVHDEVISYQKGTELPTAQMIPADLGRKAQIESLEKEAADTSLPKEKRLEAWDMAANLKAQLKELAEKEGNKD